LAQAPLDRRTLARVRSLGIRTAFWFVEDYRYLGYFRELAASYDFFFHIQGQALEQELVRLGSRHVHYLPLAADPDIFQPIDDTRVLDPYRTDLSFMGAGYPNRQAMFAELLDYNLKIWGTEWDLGSRLGQCVQDQGRRIPTKETALIYNASQINLNLHSSVFTTAVDLEGGFINPRTFEVASCGAFQIVDQRHPLARHFDLDRELATFTNLGELRQGIDFYLDRPELRKEMAAKARARVLAEHTYRHRMETLLDLVANAGL
ncbi:MAG: glycosyltransferase, partial [Thermodesulfobacteriota bacterium]|nr:glycosyltransferase [Thermodesulfobacteriota bacterium]